MILELNSDGTLVRSRNLCHDKDPVALVEDVQDRLDRFRD